MKQGKVWGDTELIFTNGIVSVCFLNIKRGGYSSKHCHNRKINEFHVIKGELEISIWEVGNLCDKTILKDGQSTIVPFGMWHKFKALTNVECIEMYEVKFSGEDIERENQGGLI